MPNTRQRQKALDTKLEKLQEEIEKRKEEQEERVDTAEALAVQPDYSEDKTRHHVAMWCVIGYFLSLILIMVGVPFYNLYAFRWLGDDRLYLDLKDTILTYQAVVGTLVGAVVAYYFKTQIDKEQ